MSEAARIAWIAGVSEGGLRVGRDGADLVVDWPGLATLRVRENGEFPRWEDHAGVSMASTEKLRRGVGQAVIRHLSGRLSLHASAVELNGRALVLVGASGAGKSSLAAALCLRKGAALLSDDMTALDHDPYRVQPGDDAHCLDDGSLSALGTRNDGPAWEGKSWSRAAVVARGVVPLGAIVALAFSEDCQGPKLRQLRASEAARRVLPQVPRLPNAPPSAYMTEFDRVADLASRGAIVELVRPRSFAAMDAALELLSGLCG
jgi:hypothetical protein